MPALSPIQKPFLASSSVRVQPALHYEPDELSKLNILRKIKKSF
jgi:hypothetical protein